MKGSRIVKLTLLGMVVFCGVAAALADVQYSFMALDVPGASDTTALGINNQRSSLGGYNSAGVIHSFLYTNGAFTTIALPSAPFSGDMTTGINDSGQIVGLLSHLTQSTVARTYDSHLAARSGSSCG